MHIVFPQTLRTKRCISLKFDKFSFFSSETGREKKLWASNRWRRYLRKGNFRSIWRQSYLKNKNKNYYNEFKKIKNKRHTDILCLKGIIYFNWGYLLKEMYYCVTTYLTLVCVSDKRRSYKVSSEDRCAAIF